MEPVVIIKIFVLFIHIACACNKATNTTQTPPAEELSGIIQTDTKLVAIPITASTRFANLSYCNLMTANVDAGSTRLLQIQYVEEGRRNGKIIFSLHGNPAWVYKFREQLPLRTGVGNQVIAPDLYRFGKCDKAASKSAQTYNRHTDRPTLFIEKTDLKEPHSHAKDRGGLIGLREIYQNQQRASKIAISYTSLPDGTNTNPALTQWIQSSQSVTSNDFVRKRGMFTEFTTEVEAAYNALFPVESHNAAPRRIPLNIPFIVTDTEAMEDLQLWFQWRYWQKPLMTNFSETEPIREGRRQNCIIRIPGPVVQNHCIVNNTNHFIRVDASKHMVSYLI